jgi:hypothetical protein
MGSPEQGKSNCMVDVNRLNLFKEYNVCVLWIAALRLDQLIAYTGLGGMLSTTIMDTNRF